ncbi:hypothetical protein BC827DRAFT_1176160, partial [Russula dissimulans]
MEEYRVQQVQADVAATSQEAVADDDTSTKGVRAPPSVSLEGSPTSSPTKSPTQSHSVDAETTVSNIRISTESGREEKAATAAKVNGQENANGETALKRLQQPAQAASGDGDEENEDATPHNGPGVQESFSFSNKRLCERWLDNLFMLLYEDLCVWTIFWAEVAHFKTQHVAYRKAGSEWEILGDLGLRLHHKEEAKEVFQRALLEMYPEEGDLTRPLQVSIRVAAYQYGEYCELT